MAAKKTEEEKKFADTLKKCLKLRKIRDDVIDAKLQYEAITVQLDDGYEDEVAIPEFEGDEQRIGVSMVFGGIEDTEEFNSKLAMEDVQTISFRIRCLGTGQYVDLSPDQCTEISKFMEMFIKS